MFQVRSRKGKWISISEEKVSIAFSQFCETFAQPNVKALKNCPGSEVYTGNDIYRYVDGSEVVSSDGIYQNKREAVAKLCHEQWSNWMEYLFNCTTKTLEGTVVIPKVYVERWTRQMKTQYEKLSQEEKDSDRAEADKFISLLED